jgi:hypothetical protein
MYTVRFSEVHQVGCELLVQNRAAAVYQSAWFDLSIHHRFVYVLQTGVLAAGATVDLVLQEADDATGTNAANIAGKAITQLTQAGGDVNDLVMIELRTEEMTPDRRFVRAVLTVAGNTAFTGGLGYGIVNRFAPVATTLVTEIIG